MHRLIRRHPLRAGDGVVIGSFFRAAYAKRGVSMNLPICSAHLLFHPSHLEYSKTPSVALENYPNQTGARRSYRGNRSFFRSRSLADLSCPQAARISRPRGVRTVRHSPPSEPPEQTSRWSVIGAFILNAGPGVERDQVDLGRNILNQLHQARASSRLSFTSFSITYSKVIRRALLTPG